MIDIGETAKYVRTELLQLTQQEVADRLNITTVHLSSIENSRSQPSRQLLERFYENWGFDLYILAWVRTGKLNQLPKAIRGPMKDLQGALEAEADRMFARRGLQRG